MKTKRVHFIQRSCASQQFMGEYLRVITIISASRGQYITGTAGWGICVHGRRVVKNEASWTDIIVICGMPNAAGPELCLLLPEAIPIQQTPDFHSISGKLAPPDSRWLPVRLRQHPDHPDHKGSGLIKPGLMWWVTRMPGQGCRVLSGTESRNGNSRCTTCSNQLIDTKLQQFETNGCVLSKHLLHLKWHLHWLVRRSGQTSFQQNDAILWGRLVPTAFFVPGFSVIFLDYSLRHQNNFSSRYFSDSFCQSRISLKEIPSVQKSS